MEIPMSNKHTPGPWVALCDDGRKKRRPTAMVAAQDSSMRLSIDCYASGLDHEQSMANARLIAAAPELYAACAEFVRKVECGQAQSTESYAQMKAALAKADGGDKAADVANVELRG
jgi:hypothetical protein